MYTNTTSTAGARRRHNPPAAFPNRAGSYGHRQEALFRHGLRSDRRLSVYHDRSLDEIYKLDAVIRFRDQQHLPAVGVQFTTRHDEAKLARTFESVRRNRVVTRFIYLVAEDGLKNSAWGLIHDLVLTTARQPEGKGMVLAVLATDERGGFYLRKVKNFPAGASRRQ